MEFGGNGGFHGNSELRQPVSGIEAPESSMVGLPSDQMKQTINNNSSGDGNECTVREQDRFMPIANVVRIMRKILPPQAKISDEAKETMQECVSEFISFITGEANDRCQKEQRKTVTAEDLLFAMSNLGFDDYIEPLTRYLQHYRECDGGERGLSRGEPVMNRAADPVNYGTTDLVNYGTTGPINYGIPTFAPAFVAQPPGFFGPATMNINGPDPSGAGPFLVPKANLEPFPPSR